MNTMASKSANKDALKYNNRDNQHSLTPTSPMLKSRNDATTHAPHHLETTQRTSPSPHPTLARSLVFVTDL
ncbi:hypothetical protein CFE70_004887 [Pyrenophora teres f. teres 0-1]